MVSWRQIFFAALLGQALVHASFGTLVCINQYEATNASTFAVKVQEGVDWQEMQARCGRERPGYGLTTNYQNADKVLCDPGVPYPIGIVKENSDVEGNTSIGSNAKPLLTGEQEKLNADSKANGKWGALRWTNNEPELHWVDSETKFQCAICHMSDRPDIFEAVYPQHAESQYAYILKLETHDRISDIDTVAKESDRTVEFIKQLAVGLNISALDLIWNKVVLNTNQNAEYSLYYGPNMANADWFSYVHWNDPHFMKPTFKDFDLISITINNKCTSSKLNLNNMMDSEFPIGYVESSIHLEFQKTTTRECFWNSTSEQGEWSPNVTWRFNFQACGPNDMISAGTLNDRAKLRPTDIATFFSVNGYLQSLQSMGDSTIRDSSSWKYVLSITNTLLLLHTSGSEERSALAILDNALPLELAKIYTLYPRLFVDSEPPVMFQTRDIRLLIADKNPSDPVVGLALKLEEYSPTGKTVVETLRQSNFNTSLLNTSYIVVTFSDSIVASANRVAIAMIATHLDLPNVTARYDPSISAWISLVQVSFARNELITQTEEDYVDIAFKPVFHLPTLRGKCAERNFATADWSNENCQNIHSSIEGMVMCRCKNIYQEGNLTSGMYIIYGNDFLEMEMTSFISSTEHLLTPSKSPKHSTLSIIWLTIWVWALPKIIA